MLLRLRSAANFAGGAYSAPRPLCGFSGPTSKGWRGKGASKLREEREKEGKAKEEGKRGKGSPGRRSAREGEDRRRREGKGRGGRRKGEG